MMNRKILLSFFAGVLSVFFAQTCLAQHGDKRVVAGWVEKIILADQQLKLRAKLDTGAKTSSIHAENIKRFERDGEPWVKFTLPAIDVEDAKSHVVERPVVRTVLIKRHKLESARRTVVEMGFCINAHYYETEFTLANRSNYLYPVLLGRRFLEENIIVDPAERFLHSKKLKGLECREEQVVNATN